MDVRDTRSPGRPSCRTGPRDRLAPLLLMPTRRPRPSTRRRLAYGLDDVPSAGSVEGRRPRRPRQGVSTMAGEHGDGQDPGNDLSRRDFVSLSVAAGLAAAAGIGPSAQANVTETDGRGEDARRHLRRGAHSPRQRPARRRDHLARRVRAAPGDARHGQAPRGGRLRGPRAEPVLPCDQGAGHPDGGLQLPERREHGGTAQADGRYRCVGRRRARRGGVRRVPRSAEAGGHARRRSACRATAWVGRSRSAPPRRSPIA